MQLFGADQVTQHVVVLIAAAAAALIVAKRVFGVFARPSTTTAPTAAGATAPGCSHCAAGPAAQQKQAKRS